MLIMLYEPCKGFGYGNYSYKWIFSILIKLKVFKIDILIIYNIEEKKDQDEDLD